MSDGPGRDQLAKTFFVIGGLLLALTLAVSLSGRSRPAPPAGVSPAPPVPQLTPAMVPLVTGDEPIGLLFQRAGCPVCHTIPGIAGAEGRVGPKLILGQTGPSRLADPGYRGQATSIHDYVIESVLTPGVYVVPGYPDHTMPTWYGQKLSAAALEKIAAYLEGLGREPGPAGS